MTTPLEILFARHQATTPKLDAIRREVMGELNHQDAKTPSWPTCLATWCLGISNKLWQELILPSRRIWTGLAAVWVLLCLVNFFQRDGTPPVIAKSSSSATMLMTFRDQQKLLNELFSDRSLPVEAERPRIYSPKPRTESTEFFSV